MKTMNDFKGTQGEFELIESAFSLLQGVKKTSAMMIVKAPANFYSKSIARLESSSPDEFSEMEANARLFANSKKVLEFAIWAHSELSASMSLTDWHPRAEKMMRDRLKQLEQVINDSI